MAAPLPPKAHRILLIEDHLDSSAVIAELLKLQGYEVGKATSLAEAKRMSGDCRFDTILCDIYLPDGSGLDFPTWIKPRCPVTRIIAMTGGIMPAEVQAIQEAGFDALLPKPIDPDTLFAMLAAPNASTFDVGADTRGFSVGA